MWKTAVAAIESSILEQSSRWQRLEPIVWCMLALVVAAIQAPSGRLPHIYTDSCQYLSAAEHLRSAHRIETSLVHFNTERSHGTVPAPLTWFPPGYPAAIALVSMIGCGCETAALWISIVSFVLVTGSVWLLMRKLDPSRWTARAAVLCWLTNNYALFFSVAALSESIFTLLGLASLLFLMRVDDFEDRRHAGICWIGSAIMAGLSYWVRYAGILWVVAFLAILWALVLFRKKGRPSWRVAIAATASAALLIVPLMIRNLILVHDWRGGNDTPFSMPIRDFAVTTPRLLFHLAFGDGAISQLWIPVAVVSIGLIGAYVITLAKVENVAPPPRKVFSRLPAARSRILLALSLIYVTGIAAIASHSVIAYQPRMFVPVLPHLIGLSTIGVAFMIRRRPAGGWQRRIGAGMVLCLLLGYGAANFISRAATPPDGFRKTQQALLEPDGTGVSMKSRLTQELKGGEVIAATNGQLVGYILKQPTLSLVDRRFGALIWNEQRLRKEMARFGATHLLVFRDAGFDSVVQESRFLSALAQGHASPWLKLVASNRDIRMYRVQ